MSENDQKLQILDSVLEILKKRSGERLIKTHELFGQEVQIGDIHSHSLYSDGRCSVDELKKQADLANLDFLFVTDHNSLQQGIDCAKYKNVWVGQEPACAAHHIGVLSPDSLFVPEGVNFLDDWNKAKRLFRFCWIAHPNGWCPKTVYTQQQIEELFLINDGFAMEILNGVFKVTDVYDEWQAGSVSLWDRLLCAGKRVTAVGGSDAHFAAGIGCAWTGLLETKLSRDDVLASLNAGRTIVSEAPLLKLVLNGVKPGGELKIKANDKIEIEILAADALGISSVRLIRDGHVVRKVSGKEKLKLKQKFEELYKTGSYYRLECISMDNKHAFTSPIYIKTER